MKHLNATDPAQLALARQQITAFVTDAAERRAHELGFGWRPSELVPSNHEDLLREFRSSQISGLPLRINSQRDGCGLITVPHADEAFTFWHQTEHARRNLTCELDDEMELAVRHLDDFRSAGHPADSLEHQLFHADTVGQVYFQALTGQSVGDAERFALYAAQFGMEEAISRELLATGRGSAA